MFEGHDSTSSGLSWMLYNLAAHPEHQQKCREEADALFAEKGSEDIEWCVNYYEYHKRQKSSERKVSWFTGFHPNVEKIFAAFASFVWKELKKAVT